MQPVTALPSQHCLWWREIERNGVLSTIEELGIGLVPHSPLGRGFLTGTSQADQNDIHAHNPRFTTEAIRASQGVADLLKRTGDEKNATPAQVALAWLLAR